MIFSSATRPTPEPDEVPAGTTILGVYEVIRELGRGGAGIVYLVRDKTSGEYRAVKVILESLRTDPSVKQFFLREQGVLAKIEHDAVVRYYGSLFDDGCLVMEYVPGPSLKDLLNAKEAMDEQNLRLLWRRLAGGLAAIHAAGIVHGDVSPSNIVLPDGNPEYAKLIDFGIAAHGADETLRPGEFTGKLVNSRMHPRSNLMENGPAQNRTFIVLASSWPMRRPARPSGPSMALICQRISHLASATIYFGCSKISLRIDRPAHSRVPRVGHKRSHVCRRWASTRTGEPQCSTAESLRQSFWLLPG